MNRDLWQKTGRVKKFIDRKILDKFEVPAIGLVFHMAWIGLGNFRLITTTSYTNKGNGLIKKTSTHCVQCSSGDLFCCCSKMVIKG